MARRNMSSAGYLKGDPPIKVPVNWEQTRHDLCTRCDGAHVFWNHHTPYANPMNPRCRMWTAFGSDHIYLRYERKRRRSHWIRRWATAEAAIKALDAEFPLHVPDPIQKAITEFRVLRPEWSTQAG